jgi:hypothetical protein
MSGARFRLRFRHLQTRRAVVGLAFVVVMAASCWLPMAGGDDRAADPQAATELAARKRILANWQARQDRIKSFYVAWKPGPNDRPSWLSIAGLAGIHQLWVASEGRFREEFPHFAFGRYRIFDHRVFAFDGKYLRQLWTPLTIPNADAAIGIPSVGRRPFGRIQALKDLERRQYVPGGVEMLAFRPLRSPYADWTLANSRVTSQNAVVGRQHYVKIQKTDAQSGVTEACWVDPSRDDLVIHFQRQLPTGSDEWTSLEYKQDPRHGWVPTGWQGEPREVGELRMGNSKGEAIVTEYRINEEFPPETFQIKSPAGTIVVDSAAKRQYFVRRDGSWRRIDLSQLGKSVKYEQLVNEDTTRPAKP